jgi:uncharacterized SAM-binding protein YcdF (DUF218 family)
MSANPVAILNPRLAPRVPSAFGRGMLFWLKKFVSFWLMPMTFSVVAIVLGAWLTRSARRARLGRVLFISGVLSLLVFSNGYVARLLVRPLETRYAPIPEFVPGTPLPPALAECRFVVVPGGGHGNTPGMAATNRLSTAALGRMIEAVRILRALPEAKLIVCGPGDGQSETHAAVLGRAAQSLGVAPERILYVDQVRDTEDESRQTKRLVAGNRVALVTSAWHMPRSMALFRSAEIEAVACPCDFVTHAEGGFYFDNFLWKPDALASSSLAFRERIGYLWIWLRGKT